MNAADLFGEDNELTFVMDPQTRLMLVRIIDKKTGQVVNQIPPEYVLNLAKASAEKNKGR